MVGEQRPETLIWATVVQDAEEEKKKRVRPWGWRTVTLFPPILLSSLFHHSPFFLCHFSFLSSFSLPPFCLSLVYQWIYSTDLQVWQKPRLSRKTRGLKAHKFHAVQHANVPSADKRAFNPAALLLSTTLPLSLLSRCHSASLSHSIYFTPLSVSFLLCVFTTPIFF